MSYKNGFDIIDGDVVQTLAATMSPAPAVPPELTMRYIAPPPLLSDDTLVPYIKGVTNLFDLTSIFAYNSTSDELTVAANLTDLNTSHIPIPVKTKKGNWVNGISPRFIQVWRQLVT